LVTNRAWAQPREPRRSLGKVAWDTARDAFIAPPSCRTSLTLLENDLRQRAGEAGYEEFIAHYLVRVIYLPGLTHGMQIGLGVFLLLVAIIGYWGFLRQRGRGECLGRWTRGRNMGTRTAPSGDAAVASFTHRASRAPAPEVTQPIDGSSSETA
jgi:Protein of Unknown function (DUF2784)